MKNFKKLGALSLVLVLLLALLAGCSPKQDEQPDDQTEPGPEDETGEFVFDYSEGLNDNGYWQDVVALDFVRLPAYDGVGISADIHSVSEDELQAEIDALLQSYSDLEHLRDRAVEDGDSVNIDYVGSIDGVEFEGGNTMGMGTLVTIGVTRYIDDFLEQLIGHTPGETIDINVTFPEDYGQDSLNGKDALFVTTINYIEGENFITPALDDAFVSANLQEHYGWQTVEDMREGMREQLREAAIAEYLQNYILDNSEVTSTPQIIIDYQRGSYRDWHEMQALYSGMDMADYYAAFDVADMEELLDITMDEIGENAKFMLIVQAIAEDAGIAPTDEQLEAFFAENGIDDSSYYLEAYGKPYFKMTMVSQSVLELMIERAVME